jgi:integrase
MAKGHAEGHTDHSPKENTMEEYAIHRAGVRAELTPRDEPYWKFVKTNCHLGFRRIDADRGSWIARCKRDGKRPQKKLGTDSATYGYEQAEKDAKNWFEDLDQGISGDDTVKGACELYVKHQRERRKKPATAAEAERRFKATVYEAPISKVLLAKLRKHHIETWIDSLKMTPATLKREFTALRAALNLAIRKDRVSVTARQAWAGLELPDVPDNRRTLFLDLAQRRRLLAAATGGVRDLIEGVMTTGARAGELTSATCGQFDVRTGTMKFTGKTKTRTVPLTPAAFALFKRLSKNKLPLAFLFTRDDGKRWPHSGWDELIRDAAKKAGLPAGTCLYVLRHSFITEAISGGLSILDIARMTGTSILMIEKHYGQFVASVALERLSRVTMI